MTVTVKNIIPAKQAESSQTTQYTASNCKTIIDKFSATNATATAATLAVNLVPYGGTAADGNLILKTRSIAAGECYCCPELVGHVIESGGFISTLAGTASALTIRASGREITT